MAPPAVSSADDSGGGEVRSAAAASAQQQQQQRCCAVCAEPCRGQQRRAEVRCPACDFAACRACHQRYLTGSSEDPHCMSCRTGWSSEVVEQLLSRAFAHGTLRDHRRLVLLDRERSLLPEVQAEIEAAEALRAAREADARARERRVATREAFLGVAAASVSVRVEVRGEDDARARERVVAAFDAARAACNDVARTCALLHQALLVGGGASREASTERRAFVRACPADGCRGFLSTRWKCGLCGARACPQCHESLPADHAGGDATTTQAARHECREDMLLSARALAAETKPCPSCGVPIFRVSGCSQMWCTQCHTAFDWRTLRRVGGALHNPDYVDFMRGLGGGGDARAGPPQPCAVGGCRVSMAALLSHLRSMASSFADDPDGWHAAAQHRLDTDVVTRAARVAAHILDVTVRQFDRPLDPRANRASAVAYLRKAISEAEFARRLQLGERAREHARAVVGLLEATAGAVHVLVARVVQEGAALPPVVRQLAWLREAHNGHMAAVQARFKLRTAVIRGEWLRVVVIPGKTAFGVMASTEDASHSRTTPTGS